METKMEIIPVGEPKNQKLTDAVWDYVGACTARGSAAAKTKAAYAAAIRIFLTWCTGVKLPPAEAKTKDIEDFRGYLLAKGEAPTTVGLRLSAVRTLFKALCRAGVCASNPGEYVKSPRAKVASIESVMQKVIFPDKMVLALGNIGDDYRGRRDRAVLLVFYLLGLRVSEVAGLDWEDWKGETLAFTGKGAQARELAAPEALKQAFARLKELGTSSGPMFLGAKGRFSVRGIQKMVDARLTICGQGHKSPHALRHSCGTAAAVEGSSGFAIQDQLGHADLRSTAIYTRVAGRFLEAPSLRIEKSMGI